MNPVDRLLSWLARRRGFVLGPAVVERGDEAWGHDKSVYAPHGYGDYIRTSSAVYTCAVLRASLLAALPIVIYRTNRKKERVKVERGPLVELLQRVNPFWTCYRLIYMSELTLCLWGEMSWFLERGPSSVGEPREIWWGRPDWLSILPHPKDYIKGYLYEPQNGAPDIPFLPSEVIWAPYPNPLDEYSGLSPLAAVQPSADYGRKALNANNQLFDNGFNIGGIVMPEKESHRELSSDQAKELDAYFSRRFGGQDKAHRWAYMRHNYDIWQGQMTPKDAEFLGGLNWSLEDVARAYHVPLDLIGGQRTYQNVEAALRALWMHCMIPECIFMQTELTEKLLPMFPAQAGDEIAFDLSGVVALQEAEGDKWKRALEQLERGALLINEWRDEVGKPPVAWGDVWWAPSSLRPIDDAQKFLDMQDQAKQALDQQGGEQDGQQVPDDGKQDQQNQQGQQEEQALNERYMAALAELRQRQATSVVARLSEGQREPFVYAQWVKAYRVALRGAGAPEGEAQRLAIMLNQQAYAALGGLVVSDDRTVLRQEVLAQLKEVHGVSI